MFAAASACIASRMTKTCYIQTLRLQDYPAEEIARLASLRFDTERKHHSIRCRLKMLAARDLDDEESE
jgi:hypothetical protein